MLYKIVEKNNYEVIAQGGRKNLPPSTVRKILIERGYSYEKTRTINICGMKGGIGKTSISTALADGASRLGFRVLAVDLDMQGNLTTSFNQKHKGQKVLAHVLNEDVGISEIIIKCHDYLSLLPSSLENAANEVILNKPMNYANFLNAVFKPIYDQYDLIILDCPPSLNKITVCASCMADLNLIPINADADAFDGLLMTVGELERLSNDFNINMNYKIFWNKYDAREKLSLLIMGEISKQPDLVNNLLSQVISTDTTFKNTKALGQSIYESKKSSAKEECFGLLNEILGISESLTAAKKEGFKQLEQEKITV